MKHILRTISKEKLDIKLGLANRLVNALAASGEQWKNTVAQLKIDAGVLVGDCLFAATGVTTGSLLSGVKFRKDGVIETETVVMRSVTGTVRYIKAEHRELSKFHLD